MRRRGWKKGDWLVKDEESGFTEYASRVERDYWGVLKLKEQGDRLHPQMFIKAKDDPHVVPFISPPLREYTTDPTVEFYIDNTTIMPTFGPAWHLAYPGIGDAIIEYNFFVW